MEYKMENEYDVMKIETWKGDWGLPSIDFECLQALALIKFCKAPVENKITNNPFWSKKGTLPIFRHREIVLYDFKDIQEYLEKQGYNVNSTLNKVELAEITAYTHLIKHKLEPALNYIWWVDERNYTELFRKWYAKALPFPFNYYYPGRYERIAKQYIDAMFPHIDKKENIETVLFGEAEKCLTTLSSRLGEQKYFFGNKPSSLDAIVYGYLAPFLKAPLISTFLQNHLKACSNLVKYVNNITKEFFPTIKEYIEPNQTSNTSTTAKEEDFPHATRNKIIAGLVATIAMLGYAMVQGIIPVEVEMVQDVDEIYEEEEQ